MSQRQFPLIKPGEPVTAEWANRVNRELERFNSAKTRNATGKIVWANESGVYEIEGDAGTPVKFAKVTRRNCCVDQLSLGKNAILDSKRDNAKYVTGKLIDPVSGDERGSNINIYPSVTMRGFLCYNAQVAVVKTGGLWVAFGSGVLRATATLLADISAGGSGQAMLFDSTCAGTAGTAGNTNGPLEAEATVYSTSCDSFTQGTSVLVAWRDVPCTPTSILYIEDACCPPEPSGTA